MDFIFLDSGLGGLPYMEYLKESNPESTCIYLADTYNFPYGEKTADEILNAVSNNVSILLKKWNPKAIVLACNTMTVVAIKNLRQKFPDTSFIGTVPAIKVAAEKTKNKRIGLLATQRTVQDSYTQDLIKKYASDCHVVCRGDSHLISFIENKLHHATQKERQEAILPAVEFFNDQKVDSVILGWTHFLHVVEDIKLAFGKKVQVIDSRDGVVRQALKVAFSKKTSYQKSDLEIQDRSFFITGTRKNTTVEFYQDFCSKHGIPFGGVIKE